MPMDFDADILSQLNNGKTRSNNNTNSKKSEIQYLESIDSALQNILKQGKGMSQSNAANSMPGSRGSSIFGGMPRGPKGFMDEVMDSFEKSLIDSIIGSDFKKKINGALSKFAEEMGTSMEGLPSVLGKELSSQLVNKFKETGLGSKLFESVDAAKGRMFEGVKSTYKSGRDDYIRRQSGTSERVASEVKAKAGSVATEGATKAATKAATDVATNAIGSAKGTAAGSGVGTVAGSVGTSASAGGAIAGAANVLIKASPYLAAAAVALYALGPAIKGVTELFKGMAKAAEREQASRERNLAEEQKRREADIKAIVSAPFTILQDAAEKIYQAWDANLRLITGTQGYTKADLQTLMGEFATRLRSEGLIEVVSGTDITENLAKVLSAGLSGQVAEEFAYIATTLNAAIPTQDFFGYAGTYASLAANAIRLGASEAEAIQYADEQLKSFASSLLYSSRQLAGGFTTGLQNAQSLFDQSVQIAQASRVGSPSYIAGVLTSVSAITGAIAPDLASSMVDAIVKAATGGNESSIVALRSLAGVNASNTEFLRQVATDPQKVFATLFNNLAKMQNMSNDAYMEVAEGLSTVFGISMDAFARIDFNYLAQAISDMNVSDASLEENMRLLASGESTATKEQLRMQQINTYLLEEGLAYVMDNEVARQIQQHMWNEQLARQVMEAEYAVNLQGAALDFLEGIRHTIENILNVINPIQFIQKRLANIVGTFAESAAQSADIRQLLELGKVGNGNSQALYQLLARNQDHNLIGDIISLMGGTSKYANASQSRGFWSQPDTAYLPGLGGLYLTPKSSNKWFDNRSSRSALDYISGLGQSDTSPRSVSSMYSWGSVGKSAAASLFSGTRGGALAGTLSSEISNASASDALASDRFNKMLSTLQEFAKEGTYEEWVKTAKTFGVLDFKEASESAGFTDAALRGHFQEAQAQAGVQKEQAAKEERYNRENDYWETLKQNTSLSVELITEGNVTLSEIGSNTDKITDLIVTTNTHILSIDNRLDVFYRAWEDYFIKHSVYSTALKDNYQAVLDIQKKEKNGTGDAINALADALTKNNVDLRDPAVQTNALLSQILKIVASIMAQNNTKVDGLSLQDTLSAMATGMVRSI